MTSISKKTLWLLTAGAFFAFFIFGFSDNLKGAILPAFLEDMKINYSLGGTILLGTYTGFMVASLTTGLIADMAGHKAVLILAGISLGIGVTGFSSFSLPVPLILSMGFIGFGLGSIELGCNALIINLHPQNKGKFLNLMSVMHGLGSTISPLYAGVLLERSFSWRMVYRWDLVFAALLIILFGFVHFPKHEASKREKFDIKSMGNILLTPAILWPFAAIGCYVALELGVASWLVEFLQKERHFNIIQSTQALSIFFVLIMLGRFIGSFVVDKFGYGRSVLFCAVMSSICIFTALLGPDNLAFMFPASGLFLSIIFPTITAVVSDSKWGQSNTILGLLFTSAGLGGIIGPWLVGVIGDMGGLRLGFSMNFIYGILLIALSTQLIKPVTIQSINQELS